MAMTSALKDELAHLTITKPCCRKAEVSALLRFGGSIHIVAGALVVEAELDTAFVARRLRQTLAEVFGHDSEMVVVAPSGLRKGSRYIVRVSHHADRLAKQAGLVDSKGRPVRGLPPTVVNGGMCEAESRSKRIT